jgi:hypothetical protein
VGRLRVIASPTTDITSIEDSTYKRVCNIFLIYRNIVVLHSYKISRGYDMFDVYFISNSDVILAIFEGFSVGRMDNNFMRNSDIFIVYQRIVNCVSSCSKKSLPDVACFIDFIVFSCQ